MNGDGYADLIVGAPYYNDEDGKAYIYYCRPLTDDIADVVLSSENKNDLFGSILHSAGDVNGDGFDDVIIAAESAPPISDCVYLYYGAENMDTEYDLIFTGGDELLSGNLNGDSFDDIIIVTSKKIKVYFGSAVMDTIADLIYECNNWDEEFISVAVAGDVNNDGYDDLITSAHMQPYTYLYLGAAEPDTTADFTFPTDWPVAGIGDVNGDGFDDILIRGTIYFGAAQMDTSYKTILPANILFNSKISQAGDLNNDGYGDFITSYQFCRGEMGCRSSTDVFLGGDSIIYSLHFGNNSAIAGGFNFNDDTYDDFVLGISGNTYPSEIPVGIVECHYGAEEPDVYADNLFKGDIASIPVNFDLSPIGDVNDDGYADLLSSVSEQLPEPINSSIAYSVIYYGGAPFDTVADLSFGHEWNPYPVGDLNGDGFDDLVSANDSGQVHIYFGSTSVDDIVDIIIDLSLDEQQYYYFSISSSADVNNDGFSDLIIGEPIVWKKVFIYLGGEYMDNVPDLILTSAFNSGNFGIVVSSAGDVNNDGFDDVMARDDGNYFFNNTVRIYFGGINMDNTYDLMKSGGYIGQEKPLTHGDIDGDGYSDILIVGSSSTNFNDNDHIAICCKSTYKGMVLDETISTISGISDFNNDQFDDIIVGQWNNKSMLYLGSPNLDTAADYELIAGEATYSGDLNGDGIDDIIGKGKVYQYEDYNNAAYIYFGSESITKSSIPRQNIPKDFEILQNYPNPFNPSTTIEFQIPNSEFVTLKISNILGQEVAVLVNEKLKAGNHTVQFDGSNLASGVYMYRIEAGEFQEVRKMILLR